MAVEKFRPIFTLPQLESLAETLASIEDKPSETIKAENVIKMFLLKISMGAASSSYVATGRKPGPASAVDILKADAAQERKNMPYGQAMDAARFYTDLNMPVPQDVQTIIDLGDTNHDSHN